MAAPVPQAATAGAMSGLAWWLLREGCGSVDAASVASRDCCIYGLGVVMAMA
jgi:hypothetical protein